MSVVSGPNGKDCLFYKTVPVNVAFIRATTADEIGNLSIEREGMALEILSIAQAAKNHGVGSG